MFAVMEDSQSGAYLKEKPFNSKQSLTGITDMPLRNEMLNRFFKDVSEI